MKEWNGGREELGEGEGLVNMDKLSHRGTCFPADEDTRNFPTKRREDRGITFNSFDILKIIEVISGN